MKNDDEVRVFSIVGEGDRYRNDRHCANPACGKPIEGYEFVLQVSTCHLRWFCDVDCIIEGQETYYKILAEEEFARWRAEDAP